MPNSISFDIYIYETVSISETYFVNSMSKSYKKTLTLGIRRDEGIQTCQDENHKEQLHLQHLLHKNLNQSDSRNIPTSQLMHIKTMKQ